MSFDKFNQAINKNFFEYMLKNKENISKILQYLQNNKIANEVISCESNPLKMIIITKIDNQFLITDRMINPESLYILKFELCNDELNSILLSNQDNDRFKKVDFVNNNVSGILNVIDFVKIFETIIRSFNITKNISLH